MHNAEGTTTDNYTGGSLVLYSGSVSRYFLGEDIAATGGSDSSANDVYTVTGQGTGISGSSDSFHFLSKEVSGDCTLTAEVTGVTGSTASMKIGVMMRQTDDPSSAMVTSSIYGTGTNKGMLYQIRSTAGTNAVQAVGTAMPLPYWVRLNRSGNNLTSFTSPDGVTWSQVGGIHSFSVSDPNVLVGLNVTSGSATSASTATFSNSPSLSHPRLNADRIPTRRVGYIHPPKRHGKKFS